MLLTSSEISRLLEQWSNGETRALNDLIPLVYEIDLVAGPAGALSGWPAPRSGSLCLCDL